MTDTTVTVLTREDCHLCSEAIRTVASVADSTSGVEVRVIDVDEAGLAEEYGDRVPYVLLDGRPAFKYRVDERALRRKIEEP